MSYIQDFEFETLWEKEKLEEMALSMGFLALV